MDALTFFGLFAFSAKLVCYALKAVVIGCCSPFPALSDQLIALACLPTVSTTNCAALDMDKLRFDGNGVP
jgi:hypothetical protein